ncbi:MAG: quinone oxidoreductase family protein [Pseudomonadota bacterium]
MTDLPKTMKAVIADGRGGPEVLRLVELPLDWPAGDKDVLIKLDAAGINPADAWFRQFGPYVESNRPFVPGHDGAGHVAAVGRAVTHVKPGDPVVFCHGGIGAARGTYAEYATVPDVSVVKRPAGLDPIKAAALPLVFITVWEALIERARLEEGEFVLIHAGAGGTGHMAVQVAAQQGARVAATVSGPEKAAFVKRLGAERPILYREEALQDAVDAWTGRKGVDVALDNVGGEAALATIKAMAPYGRIVTLMGAPFDDSEGTAYVRNLDILNVMMLTPMWFGLERELKRQAGIVADGISKLANGALTVEIAQTFPLTRAADAHRRLGQGSLAGKLVLAIG